MIINIVTVPAPVQYCTVPYQNLLFYKIIVASVSIDMPYKKAAKKPYTEEDLLCGAKDILAGKLKDGERILSVRELAAEVEVNPNTVVRSYNCRHTGLVLPCLC